MKGDCMPAKKKVPSVGSTLTFLTTAAAGTLAMKRVLDKPKKGERSKGRPGGNPKQK